MEKSNKYIYAALIIIVGIIAYFNIYNNQFLWDDEFFIQKNKFIRSFDYLPNIFTTSSGAGAGKLDDFYRPMQFVVYSVVYSISGLRTWPYHLLNVSLHLTNALLIFFIVKKLFVKEDIAFITSVLWVAHPVQTEAITFISGTADPLALLFMLSSFFCYILFKSKTKLAYLLASVIFFTLALLSKEIVIIFPLLLMLYEFLFSQEKNVARKYKWVVPFLIVALIYFILRLSVLNFGGTLNLYKESNVYTQSLDYRIYTFLAALLTYYSFLFAPVSLHMERQFPVHISILSPQVLISLFVLFGLSFILIKSIRKNRAVTFGILWFFISFIPMSGVIPVNALILEHWLYIPSIGFFLVVASAISRLLKHQKYKSSGIAITVLLVITFIFISINRNFDWKEPMIFYENILKYEEGTARIHNNLGMAYADVGKLKEAEKHYLKAIEISDTYAETHYNLANLYLKYDNVNNAILYLKRSIEINPNFFYSYELLGMRRRARLM